MRLSSVTIRKYMDGTTKQTMEKNCIISTNKSKKRKKNLLSFLINIFVGPLRIFPHNIIMNISYYCSSHTSNTTQYFIFYFVRITSKTNIYYAKFNPNIVANMNEKYEKDAQYPLIFSRYLLLSLMVAAFMFE